jgi:hypothetical protein
MNPGNRRSSSLRYAHGVSHLIKELAGRRRPGRTAWLAGCLILQLVAATAKGQGTFHNLDFEAANLSPSPPYGAGVSSLDALPGWTAYLGTNQLTQVIQNNLTLGAASIDILGPNYVIGNIIEGQYTVVLQQGVNPDPLGSGYLGASITQVGVVPANARSLRLKASVQSAFSVSLVGHGLSMLPLATGANFTLYGADISSLAGQTGALTIAVPAGLNWFNYFDSIQFSNQPVPEPGILILSAGGALMLGWRAQRQRQ